MNDSRLRRAARFLHEQTNFLRPTTQALEAAAPNLRCGCPAGAIAGKHLCRRSAADETAARAGSAGPKAELQDAGEPDLAVAKVWAKVAPVVPAQNGPQAFGCSAEPG